MYSAAKAATAIIPTKASFFFDGSVCLFAICFRAKTQSTAPIGGETKVAIPARTGRPNFRTELDDCAVALLMMILFPPHPQINSLKTNFNEV
jgi:hypothetical protein